MSIFGWDYPAGCSSTPHDDEDLSPVREHLWELLENAQIPMYLIQLVDRVVTELEGQAATECPTCQFLSLSEEAKLAEEAWRH
jgi:hypothetical protein